MKVYTKEWQTELPMSLKQAWDYFSRPENLEKITPPEMKFNILSNISDKEMYEGMLINYTVSPIANIPLRWTTEITHIKDLEYFVDEQRFGPYAMWHHEHHFKETSDGVCMTDILHYAIPFGIIGRFANLIFVDRKISSIFDYREKTLNSIFNIQNKA